MNEVGYLERLAVQLALGMTRVPEDLRARQTAYLVAAQNADGGFSGREGPSDLYYTGFGLRSLAILGALTPEIGTRAGQYLRASLRQPASVVDFFSLLYACRLIHFFEGPDVLGESAAGWEDRTAQELERFRTPDGGYNKMPGSPSGSTYHTFLVILSHELIQRPLPEPDRVRAFIQSRRREDGGYVEVAAMKRSGTNPTAAGVAVLRILAGNLTDERPPLSPDDQATVALLTGMASGEGGLRANGRIPLADLLSTFTGLWTLHDLGGLDRLDRDAVRSYVHSLEQAGGGYCAGRWDSCVDVEYTFYGLGTLALLSLS
jgi:geranylgeranyl transferase type-2 subunit beta